ncbi:ATP-grasp peptide maturase system methyltransferase [Nonomuraea sp. NPDC005983]|uniref:ATP-grasp peptide maturase system methyltransferase n=1 Tax=Nonomuraea sp. NPDC005983 TaxID=3155595 RepID=UPI0033B401CD
MNRFIDEPTAQTLAETLADELVRIGDIRDPVWREVFTRVPRHVFVPHFAYITDTPKGSRYDLVSSANPDQRTAWLDGVYSNATLLTQVNGQPVEEIFAAGSGFGQHSSSSTLPGLMAWMLDVADLHGGHRVLEIGTGTGYNAALLSERLGSDRVTSIDIDQHLTSRARERLAAIGLHPIVATGDGRLGYEANAPYDRVIATCGLDHAPSAWIEQTVPGGLIVTNVTGGLGGAMLLAQVGEDNTAHGRFLTRWAGFMPSRHSTPQHAAYADISATGTTLLDPDLFNDASFAFLTQLHLPHARRYWATNQDGRAFTGLKVRDGSWAGVYEPDADGNRQVDQGGPQRLWDRVEEAYRLWEKEGRPDWARFTFEARPGVQTVSLGDRHWELPVEVAAA